MSSVSSPTANCRNCTSRSSLTYQRAQSLFREFGDCFYQAETLTHLGDTHHAAGELPQAQDAWQQALTILDDLRHPEADKVRAKLAAAGSRTPASAG